MNGEEFAKSPGRVVGVQRILVTRECKEQLRSSFEMRGVKGNRFKRPDQCLLSALLVNAGKLLVAQRRKRSRECLNRRLRINLSERLDNLHICATEDS